MRKLIVLLLLIPFVLNAQPSGYYNPAFGLNGQFLRIALHDIVKNHNSIGYGALWAAYQQTDVKPNGKVWDVYSDIPGQVPPYEFSFVTNQCGNYNSEADCYNREHTFPESYFGGTEPMRSDIFQVYPTDGYVNNKRGNFPYGKVTNTTWISQNGSRLGPNAYAGAPSGTAFEPIDSFKGDLARTYFYMSTRYYSEDAGWDDWDMANGAELKPWAVQMLMEWHHNDPVSQKEIDRNNAAYGIQNNRNPYIDYPQFADCIWGTGDCSSLSVAAPDALRSKLRIYPNPAADFITINWPELLPDEVVAIEVVSLQGQVLFRKDDPSVSGKAVTIRTRDWTRGMYLMNVRMKGGVVVNKILVQ